MKRQLFFGFSAAFLLLSSAFAFEYNLGPFDPAGESPFYTSNAFLRHEGSAIRYWQPAIPRTWAEVVYQISVPGVIDTATIRAPIWGYHAFDPQGQAFLDVSIDNSTWTNLAETSPQLPGIEDNVLDYFDITSLAQGKSTVYVRARLYNSNGSSGGFGVPQFLRANIGAQGSNEEYFQPLRFSASLIPEPSSLSLLLGASMALLLKRYRKI